jgi:opacity protein-like surface antigen
VFIMKIISSWLLAVCALGMALPVLAQETEVEATTDEPAPTAYASVSSLNWEIENGDVAKGSGLRLVYGHPLGDHLSIELHGGLGGGSSDGAFDVELKELLGGYLRASYPFSDLFSVYGLFGYTRAKFDVEDLAGNTTESETETGGSYGGGVEIKVIPGLFDGRLRRIADYMVYLDKTGAEFAARSVGLRLDF